MTDSRYPIGKFELKKDLNERAIQQLIANLARLPADLQTVSLDLTDNQLDTAYRTGGWTIRQVVHHIADSHLHAYIRFKWTLTEDKPLIKAYKQDEWAKVPDSMLAPPQISLALLKSIHQRWVFLMKSMTKADFEKEFEHPESGVWSLKKTLALYDWHGRHHLAQIQGLKNRSDW